MTSKPLECKACQLHLNGAGFLSDTYPQRPVTLIRYLLPNEHVQLEKHFPPTTRFGSSTREFLSRSLHISEHELDSLVGYSYLIRCYIGTVRSSTGALVDLSKKAESSLLKEVQTCQKLHDKNKYDIITFSYDFLDAIVTPAFKSILEACVAKAYRLAVKNKMKVGLYLGEKAFDSVAPRLKGGLKKWSGHYIFTGE